MASAASRCPHCGAEFTADEVRRAVSGNVQGILFACVALALLLGAVMWWQGRQDAAEADHRKGIEEGRIDPLTDQPK